MPIRGGYTQHHKFGNGGEGIEESEGGEKKKRINRLKKNARSSTCREAVQATCSIQPEGAGPFGTVHHGPRAEGCGKNRGGQRNREKTLSRNTPPATLYRFAVNAPRAKNKPSKEQRHFKRTNPFRMEKKGGEQKRGYRANRRRESRQSC